MSQPPASPSSNPPTGKGTAHKGTRATKSRHAALTRPREKAWTCPRCSKTSIDARRVCGNCLSIELSADATASAKDSQNYSTLLAPETTNDPGVYLYRAPNTHRVYRQFADPLVVDAGKKSRLTAAPKHAMNEDGCATKFSDNPCNEEPCDDYDDGKDESLKGLVQPVKRDTETLALKKFSQPRRLNKKSLNFTHFISLPIGKLPVVRPLAETFLKTLSDFLEKKHGSNGDVLASESITKKVGSDCDSFARYPTPADVNSVDKLHITLLMLSLPNEGDVEFAKNLLHMFKVRWTSLQNSESEEELIGESKEAAKSDKKMPGIRVTLGGLQVMPNRHNNAPNPRQCSVVYMGLHDTARLSHLQSLLFDTFAELITDQSEADHCKKLHMTVLNKKWATGQKSKLFDATEVLRNFGGATIGDVNTNQDGLRKHTVWVDRLELNRRHTAGDSTSEYFVEDAVAL